MLALLLLALLGLNGVLDELVEAIIYSTLRALDEIINFFSHFGKCGYRGFHVA